MTIKFAHITNNKVDNVIVATQEFIDNLPNSSEWVSYYTDANGEPEKNIIVLVLIIRSIVMHKHFMNLNLFHLGH